jgi:hypothetical protein
MTSDPKENINATANATHVIVFMMVYLSSMESIMFTIIYILYIYII